MILFSILGDFHSSIFPLFYEFKDSISKHIVVYDDAFASLQENKKLIASLENFSQKYGLFIETQGYQLQEDSYDSISKLISYIEELAQEDEIYVNATDGLANISMLMGARVLQKGVKLLAYDMYANSYNITTAKSIEKRAIQKQMSIQDHFLLKGVSVASVEDKEFAHKNEALIRSLFEQYLDEFKTLKNDITSQRIRKNKYPRALQIIENLGFDPKVQQKEITGGLFEWYIYLLIKDLDFSDIEVGVTVEDQFSSEIGIRNEFDILFMKDNHLHMIECKFTARIELQSLVYKYANLINFLDDDARVMILTEKDEYAPDLYDTRKQGLESYRRAHKNRIAIRNTVVQNRAMFLEDVKSYFSLG